MTSSPDRWCRAAICLPVLDLSCAGSDADVPSLHFTAHHGLCRQRLPAALRCMLVLPTAPRPDVSPPARA